MFHYRPEVGEVLMGWGTDLDGGTVTDVSVAQENDWSGSVTIRTAARLVTLRWDDGGDGIMAREAQRMRLQSRAARGLAR